MRISTYEADTTAIHERGHTMFMMSKNIDVRYAEFFELGRTDKTIPSQLASLFNPVRYDSNAKSRYPVHLHKL